MCILKAEICSRTSARVQNMPFLLFEEIAFFKKMPLATLCCLYNVNTLFVLDAVYANIGTRIFCIFIFKNVYMNMLHKYKPNITF